MQLKIFSIGTLIVITLMGNCVAARADLGQFTVTSGSGEEVVVKHGLLGHNTTVHDRLGDIYEEKKGLLGTKDTKINILGNTVEIHKGLLGFSQTDAHSILGDLKSTKTPLEHNTNVNLKGVSDLLNSYFKSKETTAPIMPLPAPERNLPEELPTAMPNSLPAAENSNTAP